MFIIQFVIYSMTLKIKKRKSKPLYKISVTPGDVCNDCDVFFKKINDNNVKWVGSANHIVQLVHTPSGESVSFENFPDTPISYHTYMLNRLLNKCKS